MARFPLTIRGDTFASVAELASDLERRGGCDIVDNPGQMYPADHYHPMIFEDANLALAVSEAATELALSSSDPGVLLLCAHVGPGAHAPFYSAVLDRLDGTGAPIPDAAGAPGPRLADDLCRVFGRPTVHADPALHRRMVATLEKLGEIEALICNLAGTDLDRVMPRVLARYGQQPQVSALHVGLAVGQIVRSAPGEMLRVAAHFAKGEPAIRKKIAETAAASDAEWYAQHGDELEKVLGL